MQKKMAIGRYLLALILVLGLLLGENARAFAQDSWAVYLYMCGSDLESNNASATDTISLAYSPNTELKAKIVSCAPDTNLPVSGSTVPKAPEEAMTSPVSIQTIIVSKKVPVMLT